MHQKEQPILKEIPAVAEPVAVEQSQPQSQHSQQQPPPKTKGIAIISRYPNSPDDGAKAGQNLIVPAATNEGSSISTLAPRIVQDSTKPGPKRVQPEHSVNKPPLQCNEITSSDDETNTPPPVPKRSTKIELQGTNRKSLNRELAALQQDHDGKNSLNTTNQRTRRQSGPVNQPPPPLPSRRSIIPHSEDSDAENDLPNLRQAKKALVAATTSNAGSRPAQSNPKTPEATSPRVLRTRNTPTPLRSTSERKRQRSTFEPVTLNSIGSSSKMKKTALKTVQIATEQSTNSGVKSLRSRMN